MHVNVVTWFRLRRALEVDVDMDATTTMITLWSSCFEATTSDGFRRGGFDGGLCTLVMFGTDRCRHAVDDDRGPMWFWQWDGDCRCQTDGENEEGEADDLHLVFRFERKSRMEMKKMRL